MGFDIKSSFFVGAVVTEDVLPAFDDKEWDDYDHCVNDLNIKNGLGMNFCFHYRSYPYPAEDVVVLGTEIGFKRSDVDGVFTIPMDILETIGLMVHTHATAMAGRLGIDITDQVEIVQVAGVE